MNSISHLYSMRNEKSNCWRIIDEYLKKYPTVREPLTPQAVVYQGLEPSTFFGFFPDQWNPNLWDVSCPQRIYVNNSFFNDIILSNLQSHSTYDMERLNIETVSNGNSPATARRLLNKFGDGGDGDGDDFDSHPKYPIDVLRSEASLLPESIDPKMKELHLTHDDFVSIFQMNYVEFDSLPKWKKQELKKNQKLF